MRLLSPVELAHVEAGRLWQLEIERDALILLRDAVEYEAAEAVWKVRLADDYDADEEARIAQEGRVRVARLQAQIDAIVRELQATSS